MVSILSRAMDFSGSGNLDHSIRVRLQESFGLTQCMMVGHIAHKIVGLLQSTMWPWRMREKIPMSATSILQTSTHLEDSWRHQMWKADQRWIWTGPSKSSQIYTSMVLVQSVCRHYSPPTPPNLHGKPPWSLQRLLHRLLRLWIDLGHIRTDGLQLLLRFLMTRRACRWRLQIQ